MVVYSKMRTEAIRKLEGTNADNGNVPIIV